MNCDVVHVIAAAGCEEALPPLEFTLGLNTSGGAQDHGRGINRENDGTGITHHAYQLRRGSRPTLRVSALIPHLPIMDPACRARSNRGDEILPMLIGPSSIPLEVIGRLALPGPAT